MLRRISYFACYTNINYTMNSTLFELPLIEWIGYLASMLVLISLSLSSIVKLRLFNLIGSAIFSFYGFYINVYPVGIMNLIICLFNLYYLRTLLFKKELFNGLWVNGSDDFLQLFIKYHHKDIKRFFPDFNTTDLKDSYVLIAMRNMNIAGVFIASKPQNGHSEVLLDYATPQYRDYKTGQFLLSRFNEAFVEKGVSKLQSKLHNQLHVNYLKKLGFTQEAQQNTYSLNLPL